MSNFERRVSALLRGTAPQPPPMEGAVLQARAARRSRHRMVAAVSASAVMASLLVTTGIVVFRDGGEPVGPTTSEGLKRSPIACPFLDDIDAFDDRADGDPSEPMVGTAVAGGVLCDPRGSDTQLSADAAQRAAEVLDALPAPEIQACPDVGGAVYVLRLRRVSGEIVDVLLQTGGCRSATTRSNNRGGGAPEVLAEINRAIDE